MSQLRAEMQHLGDTAIQAMEASKRLAAAMEQLVLGAKELQGFTTPFLLEQGQEPS